MNKEQFEGQWKEIKGYIKDKWGKLTDDEIQQTNGKYDQFIGWIQKKYGYLKDQAEEEFRKWNIRNKK